ncbi:MAG TPA: Holliday junction resolvase RuvX [Actinomycetales bacterium]|nr:Holliday junction resolvase RuvX [Actinomycetales bacterium]
MRLAIDVGAVRVGVAASDPDGILATPVETVARDANNPDAAIVRVAEIAAEREAKTIFIGLPRTLKGQEGAAAQSARDFARALVQRVNVTVKLVDERLTTVVAHQALHQSGRKMKSHRSVIDQQAAVEILRHSLDVERSTGRVPGITVSQNDAEDGTEAAGR